MSRARQLAARHALLRRVRSLVTLTLATLALVFAACHARPAAPPADAETQAATPLPAPELCNAANGRLCDDVVQCLYLDRDKRVWIGTATGLATYANGEWSTQIIKSRDPLMGLLVKKRGPDAFDEDYAGNLHMAGRFGVRVLRDNIWQDIKPRCPVRPDLLLCDQRGDVWAGLRGRRELWRYTDGAWQLTLEGIHVPLEAQLMSSKGMRITAGNGLGSDESGFQELVEDGRGRIWVGARMGYSNADYLNPPSMPRSSIDIGWTRGRKRYSYDYLDKTSTRGAAPIAPLYLFDGTRWRAPTTELHTVQPSVQHDGTMFVMTEQGRCDPTTLEPYASDSPADALAPLLCRVHAHDGGEWLITAERVVRSRPAHVVQLEPSTEHYLALITLATSGFTCGLDDGQGNLWLGTKDAGVLRFHYE